ncbi:hypothetical protein CVT24_008329 [Panaeolus cyanescens]|uniref:alpha-1,2-Mannosidase n=1 Tax=Panaeolus cyanescens TaxID=181874 RepID=A0A409VCC8_9AGAR|nr:hypothetical protein CVT24_008329 [Panaeolus cyanescens]
MKWGRYWPECILTTGVLAVNGFRWFQTTTASQSPPPVKALTSRREQIRELWYHGFDHYMNYAFPLDELTPLTCAGQGPDWENPANFAANDVAGNFSLTLIDVLDTLVVLDDRIGFEKAVKNVIDVVSFDVDTRPQLFETTIRVMGGLLSGHIFADQKNQPFHLPWYKGELLDLAYDLGKRLLPAFSTPTGLPYARVNLRKGVLKGESVETCTAGAGSLILEFATLSRLTGDDRFEKAAHKAFFGLWNRKSDIGLKWTHPETASIGAGMDSFYEYALKWYIMSGEIEFLDVWDDAYAALMRYSRARDGYWVLAGDVQNAIKLHMLYYNLWKQHSGLPEVYDTNFKQATSFQYPLRPEFIESTWYLYRATRDPFYLDVGERVLFDITTRAKVDCGLTGISDLRTNKRDNRMESFALSETLKYLYLLFDEENRLHLDDSNYVFTTEGHILTLAPEHLKPLHAARKKARTIEEHQCPAYTPNMAGYDHKKTKSGLVQGVRSRPDVEYARHLVGAGASTAEQAYWSPDGYCEKPYVEPYSYDFILAPNGKTVPEDLSPSFLKLAPVKDGYILHNLTGIRAQIVQRLDNTGYDLRKLGHYSIRPGQLVYINDSSIFASSDDGHIAQETLHRRDPEVHMNVFTENFELPSHLQIDAFTEKGIDVSVVGYSAQFGADLSSSYHDSKSPIPLIRSEEGVAVHLDLENPFGCSPFKKEYPNRLLLIHRGQCTFLEKLLQARAASAEGIIIISDDDLAINPTASKAEIEAAGDLSQLSVILLPKTTGTTFQDLLTASSKLDGVTIKVSVPLPEHSAYSDDSTQKPNDEDQEEKGKDPNRILYINGHPLINTRLLI